MDELIRMVGERTGLAPDQARTAVETVLGFLKDRLPAPIAAQLDSAVAGSSGGVAGRVAKGLGGMFGGQPG